VTRNLIVVHGATTKIVLIPPHHVWSLAAQNAHHFHADIAQADLLSDRRYVTEQFPTIVCPITHTAAALRTSASVNGSPSVSAIRG